MRGYEFIWCRTAGSRSGTKDKRRIICLTGLKEERFATWFIFILKFDSGDRITIMVSKKIVSLYGTKLPEVDQEREIKGGPLYDKDRVLRLLTEEGNIIVWTLKCGSDLQYLGIDLEDVAELIRTGLEKGIFLGSQWCEQKKNGSWAACDAYSISRLEWSSLVHKGISVEYYIKFAINKTDKLLLLVSCHLSGSW